MVVRTTNPLTTMKRTFQTNNYTLNGVTVWGTTPQETLRAAADAVDEIVSELEAACTDGDDQPTCYQTFTFGPVMEAYFDRDAWKHARTPVQPDFFKMGFHLTITWE